MARTTINTINKALRDAGHHVEFVKGDGYFFFMAMPSAPRLPDPFLHSYDDVPSIYQFRLMGITENQVIEHVAEHVGDNYKDSATQ